jgi:hypothetical protein
MTRAVADDAQRSATRTVAVTRATNLAAALVNAIRVVEALEAELVNRVDALKVVTAIDNDIVVANALAADDAVKARRRVERVRPHRNLREQVDRW